PYVSPTSRTPIVPAILAGLAAVSLLVVNVDYPRVVDLIVAVAILWANLAYLLVVAALLVRRLRGWPANGGSGVRGIFALGRWGLPVNVLAVLWSACTVTNVGWPRPEVYGEVWYARFAA